MREFNIDVAKAGAPLITRDGHSVRIVCFDRIDQKRHGNLIGLMLGKSKDYEMFIPYDKYGHSIGSRNPDYDLMINDGS